MLGWADRVRRLGVRANVDTPQDALVALKFGAEGIGLCRTERMFSAPSRISYMRQMILAEAASERASALKLLITFQKQDFLEIFRVMEGKPVTVRLLDPPLHEFLPTDPADQLDVAKLLGIPLERVIARVDSLKEVNPMLGHRGCRLGITAPEVTEMQVRAIFEAVCELKREGINCYPEIMISFVGTAAELRHQKNIVKSVAGSIMREMNVQVPIVVGTMIEVPRAALTAEAVAAEAAFFSFGTNDLTQMTFGYSRDDITSFLPQYLALGIIPEDPFQTLDKDGVGQLIKMAVDCGRVENALLICGICGEHGGDPRSISFFDSIGLDFVSCSSFRLPVARIAAAQAVLNKRKQSVSDSTKFDNAQSGVKPITIAKSNSDVIQSTKLTGQYCEKVSPPAKPMDLYTPH